ncbi:CAP domain-containing protein [Streptomyces sp. NPDC048507]|uniref:CAP domain-containing protein n=1 Tax=Streptomyces sp. NPDC048507 TaxID=3365560 RepID=UPI00371C301D
MKKHRKKTHYKKIAVAVGALAVVGVPTAAMACLDPQGSDHVRSAASRQDSRPWQDAPLTGAGSRPVQAETPEAPEAAPAEAVRPVQPAQPVARPADEAPAEPAAETPPPARPEPAQPSAEPSAPAGSETLSGPRAEVLALVNKERAAVGCPVLTVNAKLTKAAQDHSADMAAHSNMSHTGSDGSDPGARITRAGYEWRTYGENVAYGYASAAQVMEGWMNSPGHKRNILDCSYKEIGIGLAQPGQYWTQDFGATR